MAVVVSARGSTPRVAGARQFITAAGEPWGTVGGGVAESRALALARETLADGQPRKFHADLHGRPGDIRDGVCGGAMDIWIVRLQFPADLAAVDSVNQALLEGKKISVVTSLATPHPLSLGLSDSAPGVAGDSFTEIVEPPPRLLVVGAGHIGRSLARLINDLGFVVAVQDARADWLVPEAFPSACCLEKDIASAVDALGHWEGGKFTALVTRGFPQDVEALAALATIPHLDYVGLLGSRARVATVRSAVAASGGLPWPEGVFHAPIGLEIGAETPDEIAVSIAAEVIKVLRKARESAQRAAASLSS
jgi:xanthine dehydrogenase accessory factor